MSVDIVRFAQVLTSFADQKGAVHLQNKF